MAKGNIQKQSNGSTLDFEAQLRTGAGQAVPAPDLIAAEYGISGNNFQASCRSSAAVPGGGCGRPPAASWNTHRDGAPTRSRDGCATKFTQDYAAPTALGRIELKIQIKFSTRFGNGRIQPISE